MTFTIKVNLSALEAYKQAALSRMPSKKSTAEFVQGVTGVVIFAIYFSFLIRNPLVWALLITNVVAKYHAQQTV